MSFRTTFNSFRANRALIAFALLVINSTGCQEQSEPELAAKQLTSVNVIKLTKVDETVQTATYFGSVEQNRSQTMGFTVPGKINFMVKQGQTIAANEVLADLDVTDFQEQKKTLESQLSQSQNQQEFQQLKQKIGDLDQQIQIRRITSPFECVVDEVFVFENSLVRAQSPALRIIDLKNPRIKINLPRKVASVIIRDMEVYFLLNGKTVIGTLAEKSQTERAGSIMCWFDIKTELSNDEFKFGQTVESRFDLQIYNSGFWLPLSALDRSGEGIWSVLLVKTNNGKSFVSRKLVTIVQVTDDRVLVDGDLSKDAIAIADGIHRVVPGQEVKTRLIQKEETPDSGEVLQ
ncbi:MAG: hypothetical protein P8J27_07015 [Mariniblastus sp.]|nr:hypothetical protein [Mariniblastus sp.]